MRAVASGSVGAAVGAGALTGAAVAIAVPYAMHPKDWDDVIGSSAVAISGSIATEPYLFFVTICHREHRDAFSAPNSSLCALSELCGSQMEFKLYLRSSSYKADE